MLQRQIAEKLVPADRAELRNPRAAPAWTFLLQKVLGRQGLGCATSAGAWERAPGSGKGEVLEVILGYKCPLYFLGGNQREMLTVGKGGGGMTEYWVGGESGSGIQGKGRYGCAGIHDSDPGWPCLW